ncbi:MAG: helix-turn-helix transcriptional regulator [Lachnospiraceae bacterium]|nr:helix-turn-helix transcriptional regulator [Lachnospiraceae bacterium]
MESSQEQNKLNSEMLEKLVNNQPPEEVLYEVAELFKVFGDSTRIRILYALFGNELCVGDIAEVLSMSQSSVSHQLRILKDAKLVKFRREGKSIFYALDDDHVYHIMEMGMEHVEE